MYGACSAENIAAELGSLPSIMVTPKLVNVSDEQSSGTPQKVKMELHTCIARPVTTQGVLDSMTVPHLTVWMQCLSLNGALLLQV